MTTYPTGLLINVAAGRYHPLSFRLAPLHGGACVRGVDRYRSFGHHTEGFATKEEAVQWIRQKPELRLTSREWQWDGIGTPAITDFFTEDGPQGASVR